MLLLIKNAHEDEAMELSTFEAIFRLSMEICDQYGLGCGAKVVDEISLQRTARLAA